MLILLEITALDMQIFTMRVFVEKEEAVLIITHVFKIFSDEATCVYHLPNSKSCISIGLAMYYK